MKALLLYKPGAMSVAAVRRATSAGYCCIETSDFDAIKILDGDLPVEKDKLFKSAMLSIHEHGTPEAKGLGPKSLLGRHVAAEFLK